MHLPIVHVLLVPVIKILVIPLSTQEHRKCHPEPNGASSQPVQPGTTTERTRPTFWGFLSTHFCGSESYRWRKHEAALTVF